jgi:mRNA interferase RelE/StbE
LAYSVQFTPGALKQFMKLDGAVRARIAAVLDRVKALDDPRAIGEALKGDTLGNFWKYRAGDWRILADIRDAVLIVEVIEIDHRSRVYR